MDQEEHPRNEVEIFECERYRVVAGWSSDYLLPTDRQAIRVRDTRESWKTVAEAERVLLCPGWIWEQSDSLSACSPRGDLAAWRVDTAGQQVDAEGWSYGLNFSRTYEGSPSSGLQMFVRWRRRTRRAVFGGIAHLREVISRSPELCQAWPAPRVCENIDLEGAALVGKELSEALASASLNVEWCQPAAVRLQWRLLEELLTSRASTLTAALSSFVSSQKSVAARMAEAFSAGDEGSLRARQSEVEAGFPAAARDAFAFLAVRRYRPDLACSATKPDHSCRFKPIACPHKGCTVRCSVKGIEAHDRVCPFKLITCEKCLEKVPRGQWITHNTSVCPYRQASCAYGAVGCTSQLAHKELPGHAEEAAQTHMALMLQALLDQQELIRKLSARVEQLEEKSGRQEKEQSVSNAAIGCQISALELKVGALEKKSLQELKKVADGANAEARKRAEAASKVAQKDLEPLRKELASMKATVTELQGSERCHRGTL